MIIFKLDKELEKQHKTKYWLSKETGIDNNTLAKIYSNEAQQIKLQTLNKICYALDCDLSDIMEYNPKLEVLEGQMNLPIFDE